MSENKNSYNPFDQELRSSFEGASMDASGMWDHMEGILDAQQASKKRRGFIIPPWAVAASFIMVAGLSYFIGTLNTAEPIIITELQAPILSDPSSLASGIPLLNESTSYSDQLAGIANESTSNSDQLAGIANESTSNSDQQLAGIANESNKDALIANSESGVSNSIQTSKPASQNARPRMSESSLSHIQSISPQDLVSNTIMEIEEPFQNIDPTLIAFNDESPSNQMWLGSVIAPSLTNTNFSASQGKYSASARKRSNTHKNPAPDYKASAAAYEDQAQLRTTLNSGMEFGFRVNNKLSIKTGLIRSDRGERVDPFNTSDHTIDQGNHNATTSNEENIFTSPYPSNDQVLHMNSSSETNFESVIQTDDGRSTAPIAETHYVYRYVDLPLSLQFHMGSGKLNYYLSSGVSANFFQNNKVITSYYVGGDQKRFVEDGKKYPFKKVNYSWLAGVGVNYSIGKRAGISIEPNFKYDFSSITKANFIQAYPYSFGIQTGFRYKL